MSLLTTVYNLIKPELTDSPPDITVMNSNWDTIDTELKNNADAIAGKIDKSLATTINDFLVASAAGTWVKKSLAEVRTILGLGSAAYTDSITYATAAQGATADTTAATITAHMADYTLQVPYGGTTTNVGNDYSLTNPTISSYATGLAVCFKCNANSMGAPTLNWAGRGARSILKPNGQAASLKANSIYTVRYDGISSVFILQGEGGSGNATASDLLSGKTASTDAGDIVGTMPNLAGSHAAIAHSVSGNTLWLVSPKGYKDGVDDAVGITDNDWVEGNIRQGVNMFGKTGTLKELISASGTVNIFSSSHITVNLPFTPKLVTANVGYGTASVRYKLDSLETHNHIPSPSYGFYVGIDGINNNSFLLRLYVTEGSMPCNYVAYTWD